MEWIEGQLWLPTCDDPARAATHTIELDTTPPTAPAKAIPNGESAAAMIALGVELALEAELGRAAVQAESPGTGLAPECAPKRVELGD